MARNKKGSGSESEDSPGAFSESDFCSEDEVGSVEPTSPKAHAQTAPAASDKKGLKTIEQRYQKKTQLEHILLRPDTYIGSCERQQQQMWVWNNSANKMVYKNIDYVPGLYKIFDEILVNAADIKAREENEKKRKTAQQCSTLKVNFDREEKSISVWNDGEGIPVEIHKEHHIYVPELIFGQLLTSDNYDDSDNRVTGGRNGYGAKLTNIFSTQFTVECADAKRKRRFSCTWSNNMSSKGQPKLRDYTQSSDYVQIVFKPDLSKFHMTEFEDDIVALLTKRVYDVAGTTGLRVILNGNRLPVKDFKSYVDLYLKPSKPATPNNELTADPTGSNFDGITQDEGNNGGTFSSSLVDMTGDNAEIVKIHDKQARWEVIVSASDGQFAQVSFVNSISTPKGGTHVNHVTDPLVQAVLRKVNAKNKKGMEVKAQHVKHHLWVFVNCLIVNPAFDSQTKETLTTKVASFGSKWNVMDKTINALLKSSIVESVVLWAQTKEQVELKRKMKGGGGRGSGRVFGIPKLEDANDAGTKQAEKCTLILTEGDSAKTSCIAGLSVVGRDKFGVFPLKGKMLNVRDATFSQKCENKEIQAILTIMGLQLPDKKGSNIITTTKGLRYGSVMIMTDQDPDGSHIKGLLINLIHYYWPHLLKTPGFLKEFVTPLVKCTRRNEEVCFFTVEEYEAWKNAAPRNGWKIKYYKGLGTSTDKEFKAYFSAIDKHKLNFEWTGEQDGQNIDMAFNKNRAGDRKNWISNYEDGNYIDHSQPEVTYSDFINKELVLFSRYDTVRSIPSLVDGWKPGQRKVLFGVFKRNLRNECKVAQLSGYIAEHSAYHHGEQSLQSTIVNMAQTFVGSNNINVLEPCGQFGSRKEGGKDASASRYIFTRLMGTTRCLFPEGDDPLLEYQDEDGDVIEPHYYCPVIPTVLVNGCSGIGTGWSCSVPNYSPRDIAANLRKHIRGEEMDRLTPWFRGFTGTVEDNGKGGWDTVGIAKVLDYETVEITELPVKRWTQDYKEWLDSEMPGTDKKDPLILDYRDNSTHDEIHFTIKLSPEKMEKAQKDGLDRFFRIRSSMSMSNLTLFDANKKIKRYQDELEIIKAFLPVRVKFYELRKEYLMDKLERELETVENRLRFILMVIANELVVSNKRKKILLEELLSKGFKRLTTIEESKIKWNKRSNYGRWEKEEKVDETEETKSEDAVKSEPPVESSNEVINSKDFDYLVGMPIWNLTKEKVEELEREKIAKEKELVVLKSKTVYDLWRADLDLLDIALDKQDKYDQQQLAESQKFKKVKPGVKKGESIWGKAKKERGGKNVKTQKGVAKSVKGGGKKKKKESSESEASSSSSNSEELDLSSDDEIKSKKSTQLTKKEVKKEACDNDSTLPSLSTKGGSRVTSDGSGQTKPTFVLAPSLKDRLANKAKDSKAGKSTKPPATTLDSFFTAQANDNSKRKAPAPMSAKKQTVLKKKISLDSDSEASGSSGSAPVSKKIKIGSPVSRPQRPGAKNKIYRIDDDDESGIDNASAESCVISADDSD